MDSDFVLRITDAEQEYLELQEELQLLQSLETQIQQNIQKQQDEEESKIRESARQHNAAFGDLDSDAKGDDDTENGMWSDAYIQDKVEAKKKEIQDQYQELSDDCETQKRSAYARKTTLLVNYRNLLNNAAIQVQRMRTSGMQDEEKWKNDMLGAITKAQSIASDADARASRMVNNAIGVMNASLRRTKDETKLMNSVRNEYQALNDLKNKALQLLELAQKERMEMKISNLTGERKQIEAIEKKYNEKSKDIVTEMKTTNDRLQETSTDLAAALRENEVFKIENERLKEEVKVWQSMTSYKPSKNGSDALQKRNSALGIMAVVSDLFSTIFGVPTTDIRGAVTNVNDMMQGLSMSLNDTGRKLVNTADQYRVLQQQWRSASYRQVFSDGNLPESYWALYCMSVRLMIRMCMVHASPSRVRQQDVLMTTLFTKAAKQILSAVPGYIYNAADSFRMGDALPRSAHSYARAPASLYESPFYDSVLQEEQDDVLKMRRQTLWMLRPHKYRRVLDDAQFESLKDLVIRSMLYEGLPTFFTDRYIQSKPNTTLSAIEMLLHHMTHKHATTSTLAYWSTEQRLDAYVTNRLAAIQTNAKDMNRMPELLRTIDTYAAANVATHFADVEEDLTNNCWFPTLNEDVILLPLDRLNDLELAITSIARTIPLNNYDCVVHVIILSENVRPAEVMQTINHMRAGRANIRQIHVFPFILNLTIRPHQMALILYTSLFRLMGYVQWKRSTSGGLGLKDLIGVDGLSMNDATGDILQMWIDNWLMAWRHVQNMADQSDPKTLRNSILAKQNGRNASITHVKMNQVDFTISGNMEDAARDEAFIEQVLAGTNSSHLNVASRVNATRLNQRQLRTEQRRQQGPRPMQRQRLKLGGMRRMPEREDDSASEIVSTSDRDLHMSDSL
jgi:hypothetical protein